MSVEEPGPSAASCCTETPTLSTWLREEGEEEEERDEEEVKTEEKLKEPEGSTSDESEESEPEIPPPSAIRRKVSFADAFGLELVRVKEFDSRHETGPNGLERLLGVEAREGEEYSLSCFFTIPSSDEELSVLLQKNKLELESIELLPGSTTIWGVIRVLNLSYHKAVYIRTTLDAWQSHFDLLAEYMPGSSDGQTDRFSFKLTLVPPFQPEGVRVEFCLRYESSAGNFWANNEGSNYVLLCRQRGGRDLKEKEDEKERETDWNSNKGKKSCLKANRKWSSAEQSSSGANGDLSEAESSKSEESEEERSQQEAESRSGEALEANGRALAERRNRRRAARLARAQNYFSQRETDVQPVSQLSSPVGIETSRVPQEDGRMNQDTPPILTYHQIPLLSLDWGKHTTPSNHPEVCNGTNPDTPGKQLIEENSEGSCTDAWEAFLKGTDSSDTPANALDLERLLCSTSPPSHNKCDTSTPDEKVLSVWRETSIATESPLMVGNGSLRCFSPEETLELDPPESWQDMNSSHTKEVLDYKNDENSGITSEAHNVKESEFVWVQPRSETQTGCESSEDASLPETVQTAYATECLKSKAEQGVSHEKYAGSSGTEAEVKGDRNEAVNDTLTFRGFRDKPFTDRHMGNGEAVERLYTDEEKELNQVKEHDRGEKENAEHIKGTSSRNVNPEDRVMVGLENIRHAENKKPLQSSHQSTQMISLNHSQVFDEEELDARTERSDKEASKQHEEEAEHHKPENEGFAETSDDILSVEVDNNVADTECEIRPTTKMQIEENQYKDEVIYGKTEWDICTNFMTGKETFKILDTCTHPPTLSITSYASDLSGLFSRTEPISEAGPLIFSGSCGETLRHRAAEDLDLQDPETDCPAQLSRAASLSLGMLYSRFLALWAKFWSLGHISKALLYAILFVIFVTAYLHDLPVCLAIYLLSMCWWCGQGMKKRVTTADSVD